MARAKTLPDVVNVRDLIAHLGDIPPERIRMHPLPGTATEKDLLRLVEREKILCELIDGVLVEKVMGAREGGLGAWLARAGAIELQLVTPQGNSTCYHPSL